MESKKNDYCPPLIYAQGICPNCKQKAKNISIITLSHIVKKDYKKELESLNGFYFCKSSDCKVVYFNSNEIIKQDKLNIEVGLKKWANPSTVCYCFNWTKEKINEEILSIGKSNAIADISSKMNTDKCACEINNPSGQCCLKDVKQVIKVLKK